MFRLLRGDNDGNIPYCWKMVLSLVFNRVAISWVIDASWLNSTFQLSFLSNNNKRYSNCICTALYIQGFLSNLVPACSKCQMWANFPEVEFLGTATKLKEREGKIILRVFTSAIKRCIRKFHVVVVQGRQRNVPKLVANLVLLSHRNGRIFVQLKIRVPTIMEKSLGTLLRFWGVFRFTPVQNLPSPQNNVGRVYPEFFFRVSTLYRVGGGGGGRTAGKFRKGFSALFYEGTQNDRKIWVLQYCPKDFCPWL